MKRYVPLLVLLVLLGALAASQAATAASPARQGAAFAHPTLRDDEGEEEFEAEGDESELESEACEAGAEEVEFEFEEEELEEEEFEASCDDEEAGGDGSAPKGAPYVTAPAACEVRQAESKITTLPGPGQVRLAVHYRTYAPTTVTVGLRLRDHKGSVAIDHATAHLSDKGVLHLTADLGAAAMDRALAASEFDVSLRAPRTPGFCAGALEQRLHTAKGHDAGGKAPRVYTP
jgi:hypothetical protein